VTTVLYSHNTLTVDSRQCEPNGDIDRDSAAKLVVFDQPIPLTMANAGETDLIELATGCGGADAIRTFQRVFAKKGPEVFDYYVETVKSFGKHLEGLDAEIILVGKKYVHCLNIKNDDSDLTMTHYIYELDSTLAWGSGGKAAIQMALLFPDIHPILAVGSAAIADGLTGGRVVHAARGTPEDPWVVTHRLFNGDQDLLSELTSHFKDWSVETHPFKLDTPLRAIQPYRTHKVTYKVAD
jgi:hypothetical protein